MLLFPLWGTPAKVAANAWEFLPPAKLKQMTQRPCVFVHGWATWCPQCIDELPKLVLALGKLKTADSVVVDLSTPYMQDNFSKKWINALKPPFKMYLKTPGDDAGYVKFVDKNWSGALPWSAIFRNGVTKKSWLGQVNLDALEKEIAAQCK